MKGRAFIKALRDKDALPSDFGCGVEMANLLADAVEIADEAARELIESECIQIYDWWNTAYAINGLGGYNKVEDPDPIIDALSYLDRRGLIERKEGEPHLIRFVEGV